MPYMSEVTQEMKLELSFKERVLVVTAILPDTGSYEEVVVTRDIRKKVDMSQDELTAVEFKSEVVPVNGRQSMTRSTWNDEKAKDLGVTVPLTILEHKLLIDQLNKKSDEKKLNEAMVDVWDKLKKLEAQKK